MKCEVQGMKSLMRSVRKVFAWHCIAQGSCTGHVLGHNIAIASHKARTHGPGWRTAHTSSLVVILGSDA